MRRALNNPHSQWHKHLVHIDVAPTNERNSSMTNNSPDIQHFLCSIPSLHIIPHSRISQLLPSSHFSTSYFSKKSWNIRYTSWILEPPTTRFSYVFASCVNVRSSSICYISLNDKFRRTHRRKYAPSIMQYLVQLCQNFPQQKIHAWPVCG